VFVFYKTSDNFLVVGQVQETSAGTTQYGIVQIAGFNYTGLGYQGLPIFGVAHGFGNATNVPTCGAVDSSSRIYLGSNYKATPGTSGMQTYGGAGINTSPTDTYLIRLTSAGALDTSWTCDTNGPVWSIFVLPSGNILVGGDFTMVGPHGSMVSHSYLVELDSTGAIVP
jgi:hypothetical protein